MHNAVIRFPVSAAARSRWIAVDSENEDLFETLDLPPGFLAQLQRDVSGFAGDFLTLYLDPEAYRPVYSGEGTTVKSGMRSPFMVVATKRYGFEAEIIDFRPAIYFLLKSLQDGQEQAPLECPVISLLDSCALDDEADLAIGYTFRQGALVVERTKGLMTGELGEGEGLPVSFGIRILFSETS